MEFKIRVGAQREEGEGRVENSRTHDLETDGKVIYTIEQTKRGVNIKSYEVCTPEARSPSKAEKVTYLS